MLMERDSLTGGGSDRVSSFLRHPRGREVGGEGPRLVWSFCKGQGNFTIIQRVHTLWRTQGVTYAGMCSDPCAAPPSMRTHTHTCSRTREPGAGTLVHPPSAHLHTHTLAVTFRHGMTPTQTLSLLGNPEKHVTPRSDGAHLEGGKGPLEGPFADHPEPFILGLSGLPSPGHISCPHSDILPVRGANETQGSPVLQPAGCG